mmetsp:Transcript_136944/g.355607  ORF Transcript_136944/g.355607 Transcript_136944/m.355607 type:complete len:281 (-) Transcript_136944:1535-2377(-)
MRGCLWLRISQEDLVDEAAVQRRASPLRRPTKSDLLPAHTHEVEVLAWAARRVTVALHRLGVLPCPGVSCANGAATRRRCRSGVATANGGNDAAAGGTHLGGRYVCALVGEAVLPDEKRGARRDEEAQCHGRGECGRGLGSVGARPAEPQNLAPDNCHPAQPEHQQCPSRSVFRHGGAAEFRSEPPPAQVQQQQGQHANKAEGDDAKTKVTTLDNEGRTRNAGCNFRVHLLPLRRPALYLPENRGHRPGHAEAQEDVDRVAARDVYDGCVCGGIVLRRRD